MNPEGNAAPAASLAGRLQSLMDQYKRRTGVELSATMLSKLIRGQGGTISHATVANILNQSNTNPSLRVLNELAAFFGRPVDDLTGAGRVPEHRTLPEKLTYLARIRERTLPDELHTMDQLAGALADEYGVHVTPEELERLHRDPDADPTKAVLEALAGYHGVPAGYLLDDGDLAARVEEQMGRLADRADLKRASDAGVLSIAARLGNLKPDQVAAIAAVITSMTSTNDATPGGRQE